MTTWHLEQPPDSVKIVWDRYKDRWDKIESTNNWLRVKSNEERNWFNLVGVYGPVTNKQPVPLDAEYAISWCDDVYHCTSGVWTQISTNAFPKGGPLPPSDRPYTFLKRV